MATTPEIFADIRPFEAHELPEVYDRLLSNPEFLTVLHYLYPDVPVSLIEKKMRACKTCFEFQLAFCYEFIHNLLAKASTGCDFDASALDTSRCYTFISNHRDIVLDSAILDVLLVDAKFQTTCEIAIGDNLLAKDWIKDLVRINKSFIVKRGLQPRELLQASIKLSQYMHYAITEKSENLWIAQREGRAKDSDDRTQKGIIKMLTLGGKGNIIEKLTELHIAPLTISYEYDPCDYLKAREMQLKRDVKGWKKSATDDLVSMQTGVLGFKGRIHYHASACLDDYLKSLDTSTLSNAQITDMLVERLDHDIHSHYRLYPGNYIAMDWLDHTDHHDQYTPKDEETFKQYIEGQLQKIDLDNKDEAFLREQILTMYANPTRNYLKATSK